MSQYEELIRQRNLLDQQIKEIKERERAAAIETIKNLIEAHDLKDEDVKIVVDDLEIDFRNKTAVRAGVTVNLTAKEFTLLVLLARNRGKVISKQEILEKVWDLSFDTGTNTIEVYISFLRNKLDKPFETKLIHTKPGFGYYIK